MTYKCPRKNFYSLVHIQLKKDNWIDMTQCNCCLCGWFLSNYVSCLVDGVCMKLTFVEIFELNLQHWIELTALNCCLSGSLAVFIFSKKFSSIKQH